MTMPRRRFLQAMPLPFLAARRPDDPPKAGEEPPGQGDVSVLAALRPIRKKRGVPGLIGAIVVPGEPPRIAAVGYRKDGSPEAFGAGDLVHLGSCTKAMTATMIGSLVEEGKLAWDRTLVEGLPDLEIAPGFRKVTLSQLLTHRAGLPANVGWRGLGQGAPTEQRREMARRVLKGVPPHEPGSKFVYSNVGYALAGLMAEAAAGSTWEDLMRGRVFRPLEMTTAGFGSPGTPGEVDQPWGHMRFLGAHLPDQIDNAPSLGPAGTVHCSMGDWARFATLHLRGDRGEATPILMPETIRRLHEAAKGEDYAAGWHVTERDWAGGRVLAHTGSNTRWFADIWLAPLKNRAFLSATNEAGPAAGRACDEAIAAMIGLMK